MVDRSTRRCALPGPRPRRTAKRVTQVLEQMSLRNLLPTVSTVVVDREFCSPTMDPWAHRNLALLEFICLAGCRGMPRSRRIADGSETSVSTAR